MGSNSAASAEEPARARRVISGVIHVLKIGCRWCDCPPEYGHARTIYNRFNRWSPRRFWIDLVEAPAGTGAITKSTSTDATCIKANRSAHGGKGSKAQNIGLSRGGQTSKFHTLADVLGRPFAFAPQRKRYRPN